MARSCPMMCVRCREKALASGRCLGLMRWRSLEGGTRCRVWALDRDSGASLWKQGALRRRALTGPTVAGGYVAAGDFDGYVHLLSRLDGSIAGREKVDSEGILAAPVALGDQLLVLGAGGKLVLYRLEPI